MWVVFEPLIIGVLNATMEKRLVERFRRNLKERRDALHLRLIPSKGQASKLNWRDTNDPGDLPTASSATETSVLDRAQAENQLLAVNAALDRIDNGKFGRCSNCGQEIITKHLEEIPDRKSVV